MKSVTNEPASWSGLSIDEWAFVPKDLAPFSQQDLNLWLNYEFARSSRTMVEAVLEIKNRASTQTAEEICNLIEPTVENEPLLKIKPASEGKQSRKDQRPLFATFLAKFFPEFPKIAFHRLPVDRQKAAKWQRSAGIPEECFDQDIIRFYDVFDWQTQIALENMWFSTSDPRHERYALLEVDFHWKDSRIVNEFKKWLKRRRSALIRKYNDTKFPITSLHPVKAIPIDIGTYTIAQRHFKEAPELTSKGQRHNKRAFKEALKCLAALRVLQHFDGDFVDACEYTKERSKRALYDYELRLWLGPVKMAAELLRRFARIWPHSYYPPFILAPEDFRESFYPQLTAALPEASSKSESTSDAWRKVRDLLQTDYLSENQRASL